MNKLALGVLFAKAVVRKKMSPFIVSWGVTHKCNLRCRYCGLHNWRFTRELGTEEIKDVISQLYDHGTRVMKFTGGEPFLREDIAELVNFSHDLGMYVSVSTNGYMFEDRITKMKHLDSVSISIDGPERIHDEIRGKGSYAVAEKALAAARARKINATISTVISSVNLTSLEYVLLLAKRFRVKAFFQPAISNLLFGEESNPLSPEISGYRAAIRKLLHAKRRFAPVGNSFSGLKHLYFWPDARPINCHAGKIIFRLDNEGQVNYCSRSVGKSADLNIIKQGVAHCLEQLKLSYGCAECWCYSLVELNLFCQGKIDTLLEMLR